MARFALPLSAAMLAASTLSAFAVPVAPAQDFSYAGTLHRDNSVVLIDFTVGQTSTVTLRSYSYAGGTNADGDVIEAGGFDPILTLFDSGGIEIDANDDGDGVPDDPDTGAAFDVLLDAVLSPGDYSVAVTQYNNRVVDGDLANGWSRAWQPWFTGLAYGRGHCVKFCDVYGDARTNAWAFDVLNVGSSQVVDNGGGASAVPLPAAAPLMAGALGVFGLLARRRRRG